MDAPYSIIIELLKKAGAGAGGKPFIATYSFDVPNDSETNFDIYAPSGEIWLIEKIAVNLCCGDGTGSASVNFKMVDSAGNVLPIPGAANNLEKCSKDVCTEDPDGAVHGTTDADIPTLISFKGPFVITEDYGLRVRVFNDASVVETNYIVLYGWKFTK